MLNSFRKQIDQIDQKIKTLLLKRYELVLKIADSKQKNDIPVKDRKREVECLNNLLNDANIDNSQKEYLNKVILEIHKASRDLQMAKKLVK